MTIDKSQTTQLLSCPFCGCEEKGLSIDGNRISANVYCNGCETSGPLAKIKDIQWDRVTPEDTAAMEERARIEWNKRVPLPPIPTERQPFVYRDETDE
jgi:hypothetical protein